MMLTLEGAVHAQIEEYLRTMQCRLHALEGLNLHTL